MENIKYYKATKPNEVKAVTFHKLEGVFTNQNIMVDKLKELYEKGNCEVVEITEKEYMKLKSDLDWDNIK